MWIPLELKYLRMAALGHAFMAYRTVSPYALGKARQSSAAFWSRSREYAKAGLPARSIQAFAISGVKKTEVSGGASVLLTVASIAVFCDGLVDKT